MRDPLSNKIKNIEPSGIRKFFDIVSEMKDAISLGVGEPDFDTPWHIREEGIYSLEHGRTFYTSNAGLKELRSEITKYLERRFDLKYDQEHEVLITVGGSEAIDGAFRAMIDPGDEVIVPQPSFVSYEPCVVLAGGVPVIIELKEEDEFKLTRQQILDAVTEKTKILEQMLKIHQFAIMCAPTTSQYAAVEALRNGDEDVERMREAYNQRRNYLMRAFKEMGLQCFEPFGAFYAFPCIKEFGMTSEEFADRLLHEEKVAVVPGTAFGASGEGYLRISYAYSIDDLKEALSRLQTFLDRHRKTEPV